MHKLNKIALIITGCGVGLFAAGSANHDQNFVMKAGEGGAAEVKLGQMAQDKGASQKVKDFGGQMSEDHTKAGNELGSIAQKKNIQVSSELNAKDQALETRLSGLSGTAFDKAYMSAMVKDHEADIAEFEKEANSGDDADIRAFASKTLPTLKEHLRMAKETAMSLGVTAK